MIEGLNIRASATEQHGDQAIAALQSPSVAAALRYRMAHFDKEHDAASDDARSYHEMLANVGRHFLQPMHERTHGNATPAELTAAATAAEKLAALCLAFADKAHRHAARLTAAHIERSRDTIQGDD